jgi:hypothetical protein
VQAVPPRGRGRDQQHPGDQRRPDDLDSWTHHRGRTAFENDREKIAELQLVGYTVLPATWRRLENEPAKLAAQIRRLV